MDIRRYIIENSPHITTATSGNTLDSDIVASFKTDVVTNYKSIKAFFLPLQIGTGDPSSNNIREIKGYPKLTITRCGRNFCVVNTNTFTHSGVTYTMDSSNGTIHLSGATTTGLSWAMNISKPDAAGGASRQRDYIRWFPTGKYFMPHPLAGAENIINYHIVNVKDYLDEYGEAIDQRNIATSDTDDVLFNWARIRIQRNYDCSGIVLYPDVFLASESDRSHEKANRQDYTITFPSTLYGGYVDFTKGEIVQEWENIASYNNETLPGEWISDRDIYLPGTTPSVGAHVVYKLVSPIYYYVTPQPIVALKGRNNVWTDSGTVQIKYWSH